ncbi:substrate-binding domain-containing protein [Nocardiopsis flavescens]
MSSGRHRLPSPTAATTRRLVLSPLGISAVVVALVVAAAIAVPLGIGALGCGDTRYLRVSATQSVAPVLREAATEFNAERPSYGGDCVYAQVDEIAPHRIMTALAGDDTDSGIAPHVWVPESSAWVELARMSAGGTRGIETDPPSLASSPVVMAAPEGTEGMPDPDATDWTLVLPGERDPERPLVMVDPNRGADGMAVMHAVRRHLGGGDAADTAMTDFVRDVQTDSAFGEIDLSAFFTGAHRDGARPAPVIVVPEQSVVSYNANRPGAAPPLLAHYPREGTVSLDYPYVTTTDTPSLRSAAADLYEVLRAGPHRDRLRELGFRDPGGEASAALADRPGIIAEPPPVHGDLTGDALLASVTDWNRLSMPSRTLVLADVSANMAEDLNGGGGESRMEAARQAALLGLGLFPDATDMGLWLMSEEYGEAGREEAAGMHRLGDAEKGREATRRQELVETAETIDVQGGGSRLYDNILNAYDEVQSAYDEEKINSVILLTAGQDEGSSDLSHAELVAALEDRFDPRRPVSLFIIAFGGQADREELRGVAAATSGSLFVTDDPDEIGDIFLSSISRRLCVPDCDN